MIHFWPLSMSRYFAQTQMCCVPARTLKLQKGPHSPPRVNRVRLLSSLTNWALLCSCFSVLRHENAGYREADLQRGRLKGREWANTSEGTNWKLTIQPPRTPCAKMTNPVCDSPSLLKHYTKRKLPEWIRSKAACVWTPGLISLFFSLPGCSDVAGGYALCICDVMLPCGAAVYFYNPTLLVSQRPLRAHNSNGSLPSVGS